MKIDVVGLPQELIDSLSQTDEVALQCNVRSVLKDYSQNGFVNLDCIRIAFYNVKGKVGKPTEISNFTRKLVTLGFITKVKGTRGSYHLEPFNT